MVAIEGRIDPKFESVQQMFSEQLERHPTLGMALCVYLDGQPVIDVWGGMANPEVEKKWDAQTLCTIDSTTKSPVHWLWFAQ